MVKRQGANTETMVASDPDAIPTFETEEEARAFWERHDSAPFFPLMEDLTATPPSEPRQAAGRGSSRARQRPATEKMDLVSLRLPPDLLAAVKALAARRQLPYQTLLRSWIYERLTIEETAARQTERSVQQLRAELHTLQEELADIRRSMQVLLATNSGNRAGEPSESRGERHRGTAGSTR